MLRPVLHLCGQVVDRAQRHADEPLNDDESHTEGKQGPEGEHPAQSLQEPLHGFRISRYHQRVRQRFQIHNAAFHLHFRHFRRQHEGIDPQADGAARPAVRQGDVPQHRLAADAGKFRQILEAQAG